MTGLPEDVDLRAFIAREVTQICIGFHQLQIHFDGRVSIFIESECLLRLPGNHEFVIADFPTSGGRLGQTLGTQVVAANRTANGGMLLVFDSRLELEIMKDAGSFESFQLVFDGQTILG